MADSGKKTATPYRFAGMLNRRAFVNQLGLAATSITLAGSSRTLCGGQRKGVPPAETLVEGTCSTK